MNFDSKLMKKLEKYNRGEKGINLEKKLLKDYLNGKEQEKPTTQENFIGLEIECLSPREHDKESILKSVLEKDLEDYVHIGDDGSITGPGHSHEIKLLIPEKKFKEILTKFSKIIKEHQLTSNRSCGLHVHLDMRHRDYQKCLKRLKDFQHMLFPIVESHRWNSHYCKFTQNNDHDRRAAINPLSYRKHRTIEIRLHHGTTDIDKIYKWVRLLLNVVNTKSYPKSFTKNDVLQWKALKPHLKNYVNRNWNDNWTKSFKRQEKQRVIHDLSWGRTVDENEENMQWIRQWRQQND